MPLLKNLSVSLHDLSSVIMHLNIIKSIWSRRIWTDPSLSILISRSTLQALKALILSVTQYNMGLFLQMRWPSYGSHVQNRCLHLPPLIIPYIFPTITCFKRQFLCKMWPIQLAFLCFIVFRMALSSLILRNISSFQWSVQLIFSILQ